MTGDAAAGRASDRGGGAARSRRPRVRCPAARRPVSPPPRGVPRTGQRGRAGGRRRTSPGPGRRGSGRPCHRPARTPRRSARDRRGRARSRHSGGSPRAMPRRVLPNEIAWAIGIIAEAGHRPGLSGRCRARFLARDGERERPSLERSRPVGAVLAPPVPVDVERHAVPGAGREHPARGAGVVRARRERVLRLLAATLVRVVLRLDRGTDGGQSDERDLHFVLRPDADLPRRRGAEYSWTIRTSHAAIGPR